MTLNVFDFAAGAYPKESRISRAKASAVGGKRKRCTKGKNCSAACIAANMVCLVDLPWVGSALTKAKAQIQAAKGGSPVQAAPTAKAAPAPTPKAQPAPAPKAQAAPTSAPTPKPAAQPIKVHDVGYYKKLGLPFLESMLPTAEGGAAAQTPDGKKVIVNVKKAIAELKAQPAQTAPKPAAAATPAPAKVKPAPKAAPAAKAPPAAAPAPAKTANQPQPASPGNPHGLSNTQQKIWGKALEPVTDTWFRDYGDLSQGTIPQTTLKQQNRLEELRMLKLLKVAHNNNFTKSLDKIFNQVKINDKSSHLTEDELKKLPTSIQSLVQKFGQVGLKRRLLAVEEFTGSDYRAIRNAMRNRPPEPGDEKLPPDQLQKKIDKYKKKAEQIQEFLEASRNRPAVPKFRGVAMDRTMLDNMINLANTGGSFKEDAMNSWSTQNTTARSFAHPKGLANNRVIFRTINKSGSSVKAISDVGHEDEILTPAGARYKVVGYTEENIKSGPTSNKIHFFDVVEY